MHFLFATQPIFIQKGMLGNYGFGFTPGTGLSPAREILFHAQKTE